ncbi:hypothetical protein K1Y77_08860 [Halomonas qaidamensis]|uniref:Uncharacterized protein n=1 Tax=Halomonas qaidamensis TaxID=2866211 RepID=A0ABY6JLG2_9GAMM|nr:hypothetical protein [Halomonas qaidamensis]UYV17620.1 hypothetical protein K1Y77_08860 [Halomonas qaidamensis]
MTLQNWLMISPALLILAIAVGLIPFIIKAGEKYSRLASELGESRSQSTDREKPAVNHVDLDRNTRRLAEAIEELSANIKQGTTTSKDADLIDDMRKKFSKMKTQSPDDPTTHLASDELMDVFVKIKTDFEANNPSVKVKLPEIKPYLRHRR